MAITLVTGQPGHGKTLYAISRALEFQKQGRPVYVAGIKDFNYQATGCLPLDDFAAFDPANLDDQGRIMPNWQLLPHGAVIVIDECYDKLPTRASGAKVPPHIDALARHRHHGYDIILICQMHNQIDAFVKGLIDPHLHVRRKFGLKWAVIKEWDRFKSNTDQTDTVAMHSWKYPKRLFGLYTSATMHTYKAKLPWYVIALPFVALGVGYYVWKSYHFVDAGMADKKADVSAVSKAAGPGKSASPTLEAADQDLRRSDYAAWLRPRVPGQPWTAPAYDNLQPQGTPDVYCVASESGSCSCITEQGTKYPMDLKVCRVIARDGVYNPFRRPAPVPEVKPAEMHPSDDALKPAAPGTLPDAVALAAAKGAGDAAVRR